MSVWTDAVAATSPYGWWKLDEASGSVANDSSGNNRHASYLSTSELSYARPSLIPGDAGGASLTATGVFGNVQASSLSYSSTNVTYALTMKVAPPGVLFRATSFTYLSFGNTSTLLALDSVGVDLKYDPTPLFDGTVHFVVLVVKPTSAELWVDGVQVGSATHSRPSQALSSLQMKQGGNAMVGDFDDLLLWNTALSSTQIGELSNAWGATGPLTPSLSLAGATPALIGAFEVTNTGASSTISLSGALPALTGAFALDVPGAPAEAFLDGTLPALVGSFDVGIADAPAETDTTNRIGGRRRSGYGIATWSPAVVPAPATVAQAQAVVTAAAHGPVTMQGTQPIYTTSSAAIPRGRQRIIVGGKDVTYFRDVPTPDVDYQLAEPLLYGPATLTLPQVNPAHETLGTGALKWLRPGKKVVVQRVINDVVVATDYKGIIVAFDTDGANLRVEIGGEAQGRAALMQVQLRIFDVDRDLGQLAYRAITSLGLPFTPRYGPTTGIRIGRFGGMGHLDYIQEICARAWTRAGRQWTIMPGDDGRYAMARKDASTVHFTVFSDDARSVASLRRDIAEEPNRIYATGVTPEGQRVRFGAYPGLKQGRPADYPMAGGASFGIGTTDADTLNGDGVSVMLARLEVFGYIGRRAKSGGYDSDAAAAVEALQEDANLPVTGTMNEATWAALFDLNVTGFSLSMANIRPAAQRRTTRKWTYSASGAIMGLNPYYDPTVLKVDRNVDMGAGFSRSQMREWARAELQREDNWVGTITLHTGAVLRGQVAEGATVTEADVMDARDIRPGMNAWLPQFDGGILLHVSGVDFNDDGVVRLTVDTQARDAMEVWQVIERNRETRRSPARRWMGNRSSSEIKDSIDIWDEVGGYLGTTVDLEPGWNTVEVVAGQEGTVSRIRLELGNPAEFACAVFGRDVSVKRLSHLVPDPLTAAGMARWEKKAVRDVLDDLLVLGSWGTLEEPAGYSPGKKSGSATLRGVHRDEASFSYRCRPGRPVLTVAVWVPAANTLRRGQVMWNQLEVGY